MDIQPENINPQIVKIGRTNPKVKEIFTVYLAEVPIIDGKALTWVQTLEMMVLKLAEQYGGAIQGWKDHKKAVAPRKKRKKKKTTAKKPNKPKKEKVLEVLVDEIIPA